MQRDLDQLEHTKFDVLVIGAGIYGIFIARDAVLRGLKVCLIEAGDFGSATSHNSLKVIHGGIRYFQHLNFKRVYESVREREMWMQISKRLIKPMKFVLPTYGYGSRGPFALGAAVSMHNSVAALQSRQRAYPNGHMISKAECQNLLPDIDGSNISGGAVWYDGQIVDADRLHIELLKDAYNRGLCLANYVSVQEILLTSDKAIGVCAKDEVTGREFDIHASVVVNATGPWAYKLLKFKLKADKYKHQPLSKNFNIVVDSINKDFAFGVKSKRASDAVVGSSKRVYFFTPWLNKTVIGTAHFKHEPKHESEHQIEAPLDTNVANELPGFIEEINEAYPSLRLSLKDIRYVYAGFTPAEDDNNSRAHHTNLIDHAEQDDIQNLFSVVGVKYTTARSTAQQVVRKIFKSLKIEVKDLPSYAIEELRDELSVVDDLSLDASVSEEEIVSVYRKNQKQHIKRSIGTEMVLKIEDYVLRRNNLAVRGLLATNDLDEIIKDLSEKLNIYSDNDETQSQSEKIHARLSQHR